MYVLWQQVLGGLLRWGAARRICAERLGAGRSTGMAGQASSGSRRCPQRQPVALFVLPVHRRRGWLAVLHLGWISCGLQLARLLPELPVQEKRLPGSAFCCQHSDDLCALRRRQVLHFLQSNRVRVLVMGDSLQKQLHGRLMHMFRGSRRPIDMRIFAMVSALLCHATTVCRALHCSRSALFAGILPVTSWW